MKTWALEGRDGGLTFVSEGISLEEVGVVVGLVVVVTTSLLLFPFPVVLNPPRNVYNHYCYYL